MQKISDFITIIVALILVISPTLFAMRDRWVFCVIFFLCTLILLAYLFKCGAGESINIIRSHIWILWILIVVAMVLQIIPMPQNWLKILSPKTLELSTNISQEAHTISMYSFVSELAFMRHFMLFILLFVIVHTIHEKKQLTVLVFTIVCTCFFEILISFGNRSHVFWMAKQMNHLSGTFVNRNHFGCLLAMSSMVAIGLLVAWGSERLGQTSKRRKLAVGLTFLTIILSIITIFLSGSKGALISLAVACLFFMGVLFFSSFSKKKLIPFITIFFIAIFGFYFLDIDEVSSRWEKERFSYSLEYRMELYKNSIPMILDYPFLGVGGENFRYVYRQYQPPSQYRFKYLHNDWLQIVCEYGILPALLFFYVVFFFFLATCYKLWHRKDPFYKWVGWGSICAVLVMIVHSLVDFNFLRTSNAVTVCVLASIAIVCANERKWKYWNFSIRSRIPILICIIPIFWANWYAYKWGIADIYHNLYQNWKNKELYSLPIHVIDKKEAADYLMAANELNPSDADYNYEKALLLISQLEESILEEAKNKVIDMYPKLEEEDSNLFEEKIRRELIQLQLAKISWVNLQIELAYIANKKAISKNPISPFYHSLDLFLNTCKMQILSFKKQEIPQKYQEKFDSALKNVAYIAPVRPISLREIGHSLVIYTSIFPDKFSSYEDLIKSSFGKAMYNQITYADEIYNWIVVHLKRTELLLKVTPKYYLHYNQLYNFCWRNQYYNICSKILDEMPNLPRAPLEWKTSHIEFKEIELYQKKASIAEINGQWILRKKQLELYQTQLETESKKDFEDALKSINDGRYLLGYKKFESILKQDYKNINVLLNICELSLLPELKPRIPRIPLEMYLYKIIVHNSEINEEQYRKYLNLLKEINLKNKKAEFLEGAIYLLRGFPQKTIEILTPLSKDENLKKKWRQYHLIWWFLGKSYSALGQIKKKEDCFSNVEKIVPYFQKQQKLENDTGVSFEGKINLLGFNKEDKQIKFWWECLHDIERKPVVEFLDENFDRIERRGYQVVQENRNYPLDFVRFGEVVSFTSEIPTGSKYIKIQILHNRKYLKTDLGNNFFLTKIYHE